MAKTKTTKTVKSSAPYVPFQWSLTIGGALVACAISFVLVQFGAAVGLADDNAVRGLGSIATWGVFFSGLWILLVQVIASYIGGYLVGRLKYADATLTEHETELSDGLYGLVTWALSTILVLLAVGLTAGFSSIAAAINPDTTPIVVTEMEQNTAIFFAFLAGATSLASAVVSWIGAVIGGDHRDTKYDISHHISFKR